MAETGMSWLGKRLLEQAAGMNAAQLASYEAGIAEGFRRGIQKAADTCEKYRDEIKVDEASTAVMVIRACANRIRALRPEGDHGKG